MAVIVCYVEKPLFYSSLLIELVHAIMILNDDNGHIRHTRGEERDVSFPVLTT